MTDIHLTAPQYNYLSSPEPYPAFVGGYGSGKSEGAVIRSVAGLLANPGYDRGFYEPTYDLIKMIAWPRFEKVLADFGITNYRITQAPVNQIIVPGYGKIIFRNMDRPERIIGYEHADADIDELDTLPADKAAKVWRAIIARNRQKKDNGKPNTIGTSTSPEGFRFVYQTWKANPQPGYGLIHADTYSNQANLPANYIADLEAIYPEQQLNAYLHGQFVNMESGSVYNCYDRAVQISNETVQPGDLLRIGMDFNVTKMAASVFVDRGADKDQLHLVDEFVDVYDTPTIIDLIRERYPKHQIIVYPDATGDARKTVGASVSDLALLRQAGFSIRAKKTNPRVRDRVQAVNAALSHGFMFVNPKTAPRAAECLETQAWKNGIPDKSAGYDHSNDATGYVVAYERPISKPLSHIPLKFDV